MYLFNRVNLLNEDTQYWLNMGVSAGSVVSQNFYVLSQCHFLSFQGNWNVMETGEIIGIVIVAVVAFVIIIIYACKCYSDYSLGHHEQNVKPIDLDNDNELALISVDCAKPIPHDPYSEESALARKDYNDLEMVSLSVEQFIRKENYRKSARGNQKNYKKLARSTKSSSSTGIEEDPGHFNYHGISNHTDEIDGEHPQSVKSPVANGNGFHNFNTAIDAPVIVHHSLGHQKSQEKPPPAELYEHIYAPVERSKPAPTAPSLDAPTYFRPVKAAAPASNLPQASPETTSDPSVIHAVKSEVQPLPAMNQNSIPERTTNTEKKAASLVGDKNEESETDILKPALVSKPRKPKPKSIENVPPNEQEMSEDNLFFIPEDVVSPKTPKKNRKERTIKTLDDLGVTPEKPKTQKKSKKANGKGEGGSKGQKRRKKSAADLDIAKPVITTDVEPIVMSPKSPRPEVTNSMGLKSPPIPPKPLFNPLLSPTVQTRNEGHARVSQL